MKTSGRSRGSYYSSGRYYRALWKANAEKHPEIDKLTVNDVIILPPVEDLDPAFIDPPVPLPRGSCAGQRALPAAAPAPTRPTVDKSQVSSSSIDGEEPVSPTRTNRGSADGVPVRRSSRTDPDSTCRHPRPLLDVTVAQTPTPPPDIAQGDDNDSNEPEMRTAARPRASGSAPLHRPVYKVRQYDSLRSIARDMLGDSHRSSEILDLNRDLIDDPTHLIVGQVLELPDDARTTVRRSASR